MPDLTDRQRTVKMLLDQGKGAREIAEITGTTRNAVYQIIQRFRRQGVLPPGFTASGLPAREQQAGAGHAGFGVLAQEVSYVRDELDRLARRLSAIV